jgi:hypothetical protein
MAKARGFGVVFLRYGRFGWFADPEGNRVELWEPKGDVPAENA